MDLAAPNAAPPLPLPPIAGEPPRVLLVAPPWQEVMGDFRAAARFACVSPPQGLTYLAGAVLARGGECRIVDMEAEGVSREALLDQVAAFRPHLLGLSATTPIAHIAGDLARAVRDRFPELPICLGGVHATVIGAPALAAVPAVDFLALGEGEETLCELLEALGGQRPLTAVQSLVYREGGEIVETPPRPRPADLDALPRPARHLLHWEAYTHVVPGKGRVRYASLFTSRGCPFRCAFCSQHTMYGRSVRTHSVARVIAELRDIVEHLGVGHVVIMDENLTLERERTLALCRAIEEAGLRFTFEGWTHAATVDAELLAALRRAGMTRICFGIESGDPAVLRRIHKGTTLAQLRRAFRLAREVGLETRGAAMLGHPGETRRSAWATIRFARSLRHCQQLFLNFACPYPGTELYALARAGEAGLTLLSEDFRRYQRYGEPVLAVNDLAPADLKRLQRLGLLLFYLTPARLWHNLYRRAGLRGGLLTGLAFARGVGRSLLPGTRTG